MDLSNKGIIALSSIFVALLCVGGVALIDDNNSAADPTEHVFTGSDGLTFTYVDDGTLTISGSGPMAKYSPNVLGYLQSLDNTIDFSIDKVIIENGVTSVSGGAFFGLKSLISVDFPESLASIGDSAFAKTSIESVVLHSEVDIGSTSFFECTKLKYVSIENSNPEFRSYCFQSCFALNNLTIKSGIIVDSMFCGCTNLVEIHLGSGITSIALTAFANTGLKTVYASEEVYALTSWPAGCVRADYTHAILWDIDGDVTTTEVIDNVLPVHDDPVKDGFNFVGWSPSIVVATEDATYTALFEEIADPTDPSDPEDPEDPEEQNNDKNNNMIWLIVGIFAVVLIILLLTRL